MALGFPIAGIVIFVSVGSAFSDVLFSALPRTIVVVASPKGGQVLKAGTDTIEVKWSVNRSSVAEIDSDYAEVKVKICYAPISQEDRPWRKTEDDVSKDKTCQFTVAARPYRRERDYLQLQWTVEREVPTATYFVRIYAYDASGRAVAYGQTTDDQKTTSLFEVEGITGRHTSIDIAAACFSAFSVISLIGFFFAEKWKATRSSTSLSLQ